MPADPITNQPNLDRRERLPVEAAWLTRPTTDWTYSHHPHLAWFGDRMYAMWSSGRVNEDDLGQRVVYANSPDGLQWSEPQPLVDSSQGEQGELVLTAGGWHVVGDTLVAYAGYYEYQSSYVSGGERPAGDNGHFNTGLVALTSKDGRRWREPRNLRVPVVPNHGPQTTASGRLILSGNVAFPYTDDPGGLHGWRLTGIFPADMRRGFYDDSEGFWKVSARMGWPVGLCEGAFYQTDDLVLHMLLRSGTPRLWVTESSDDGETWSPPWETDFTDNAAKFHLGRLPDGRYYYVGNPDPEPAYERNPLVLSLSDDGAVFDRHLILADEPHTPRVPGLHKGGVYGYPHSLVHDGALWVIVSVAKESVLVLRADLAAL